MSTVFTLPELEKKPTVQANRQECYLVPKPGTLNWKRNEDTDPQEDDLELLLERLRQRCTQRRVLLKPAFQDFDK